MKPSYGFLIKIEISKKKKKNCKKRIINKQINFFNNDTQAIDFDEIKYTENKGIWKGSCELKFMPEITILFFHQLFVGVDV